MQFGRTYQEFDVGATRRNVMVPKSGYLETPGAEQPGRPSQVEG